MRERSKRLRGFPNREPASREPGLLQRNNEILTCEIREGDRPRQYGFELASKRGAAETLRFDSPTDLINSYLRWQAALRAQGWRPRVIEEELG